MSSEQKILKADNTYGVLMDWIRESGADSVFLVSDASLPFLKVRSFFESLEEEGSPVKLVRFDDFQPNPLYESVVKGVQLFRSEGCSAIIAVGGGSAMDVAKCIKLYSNMEGNGEEGGFLKQEIVPNDIPFLVIPTTAGTGSEATRYAVIYYEGAKQSVTHTSIIPGTVLFDPSALKTLPIYQKKATMADALCHAVESYWSVNSTEESREISKKAILAILSNMEGYLANTEEGNAGMLAAAHLAGQAINITQHEKVEQMKTARLIGRITKPELGAYMVTRDDSELEIRAQGWNAFNNA